MVARLFVAWSVGYAHPERATDMAFASDVALCSSVYDYANDLPDQSIHKKELLANLTRRRKSTATLADAAPGEHDLLVNIFKLGGHRDDKIFEVQPDSTWTLATVKELVCNDDTARAHNYLQSTQPYREFSGGRLMSIMASSFHFRAFGFALPLPESTSVREAFLTTVLLVPERNAGLHLAQELNINFVRRAWRGMLSELASVCIACMQRESVCCACACVGVCVRVGLCLLA